MLFHEWKEFITYPLDSNRIRSRAERFDTSKGFKLGPDGKYPSDYSDGKGEKPAVIPLSTIIVGDDVFECMEISDSGWVVIWTREKVWYLAREGNSSQIEKLRYVPRHPPSAN